jgi:hypothetical protein
MFAKSALVPDQGSVDIIPLVAVEILTTEPAISIVLDERIMVPWMLPEQTFQLMFDAEFRDGFRGRAQRHLAYSASFHGMIVSR